uniref:Reticulon-like protein n=1 Tax=Gossypium raimondii TaxID=29730 RepID=A0A0D2NYA6_GOSRA|nr:hypothetical protein B456_003G084400 [Gossypium raimondii]
MAEHEEKKQEESLMEKIAEKIHGHDSSSSSSDSDDDKPSESSIKDKVFRLFGREKPVHHVFGGGKPADILLWRNKKISAGALGVATVIWVLFELLEYHLLTLVCHLLILALALLFLWSNATQFINKSTPHIPEVQIPKEPVLEFVMALRFEINRAFAVLRDIALGRDLKMFLSVCYFLVSLILNTRFICLAIICHYSFMIVHFIYMKILERRCDCSGYCWIMGLVYCGKLVQLLDSVLHSLRTTSHCTCAVREV